MEKEIFRINGDQSILETVFSNMERIMKRNLELGNIEETEERFGSTGGLAKVLKVLPGKRIDYALDDNSEPLYAEESTTDSNFCGIARDLLYYSISDMVKGNRQEYSIIKNGDRYSLYSTQYGKTIYAPDMGPILEYGDVNIAENEGFKKMLPGEFEFLTTPKVHFSEGYDILMNPDELVKKFAGTAYGYYRFRLEDESLESPNMLYSDSFYESFKSIREIAENNGIDYKSAFLKNMLPMEKEIAKRALKMKNLEEASIDDLEMVRKDIIDWAQGFIPAVGEEGVARFRTNKEGLIMQAQYFKKKTGFDFYDVVGQEYMQFLYDNYADHDQMEDISIEEWFEEGKPIIKKEHSTEEIVDAIEPTESGIKEIIDETLAVEKNKEAKEQDGQTQADE